MTYEDTKLKLIYVLKIGFNSKYEGLYEFIFSHDESNIDFESWCWDMTPACDHSLPPTEDYVDAVFSLKTKLFDLFCLHEAVDRPYMHGYNTIHALAYEIEHQDDNDAGDYDEMFNKDNDDIPILVFHYGMSLSKIKEMFLARNIVLKNNEFIEANSIKF